MSHFRDPDPFSAGFFIRFPLFEASKRRFAKLANSTEPWLVLYGPKTATILTALVVGLGAYFCISAYAANRTFFIDEVILADNLMTKPLDGIWKPVYSRPQVGGAIIFLVVQKLLIINFGASEYSLRLFPLIAALLSILIFPLIARKCLSPVATLLASTALCFGNWFIYYGSQNKPYTLDVLTTLVVLWIGFEVLQKGYSRGKVATLLLVGVLAPWTSLPSVFSLAGIGVALFVQALLQRRHQRLIALCGLGTSWLFSFGAHYCLVFLPIRSNAQCTEYLKKYWHKGFLSSPLTGPKQFQAQILELFDNPLGLPLTGLALAGLIVGAVYFLHSRRWQGIAIVASLAIPFLASALKIYPMRGRVSLFAIPLALLLIAAAFDYFRVHFGRRATLVVSACFGCLLWYPIQQFGEIPILDDVKPILQRVGPNLQAGDTVFFYYVAHGQYEFYQQTDSDYRWEHVEKIRSVRPDKNLETYLDDIEQLAGRNRVWVIFSHAQKDSKRLTLTCFDRMGNRLKHFNATGASGFLYDLRQQSAPEDQPVIASPRKDRTRI